MAMTRYEPWGFVSQLQNDINRLFEESQGQPDSSAATADWIPAADIEEHPDRFYLYVDVPGIEPKDIDITLEDGILSITGQRERAVRQPGDEGNGVRRRVERAEGRFHRRFVLPDTVDADSVKASGKHGVLEIEIPKQPKSQPRKIEIKH